MDFLEFFQGQTGQAILPLLIMVVLFYFLLYRPQKKQQKRASSVIEQLEKRPKKY